MTYASKELVFRAEVLMGRTVTYETINEYQDAIEDLARDLSKATELPTDAEHEAAIEAWRMEAKMFRDDSRRNCYIVTGSEIDEICDLARRAPRPGPEPQPLGNPLELPEPRPSSALLAESKKAVGWLIRTRHPDALRFIDPLLAAIEAEEARGPSEVEKTDIMQQRGCLNHVGDPDPTCRICYLTMSDIAEELRDERDEAIKRADGLRSDVDYWQNIVTASVKACGYPGLLHSELFSHVEQLRKERDEALANCEVVAQIERYKGDSDELDELKMLINEVIPYADANDERGDDDAQLSPTECVEAAAGDIKRLTKERDEALARAEKAEAALSTPPQPNHASNDQPIRWFLCQYGDPYDDCSDTDRDAAIAELCRRALGER